MNLPPGIFEANSLVWPLVGVFFGLVILKNVRNDVRPIFIAMTAPLKKQAETNAVAWAIGMMLGVLSSLQALTAVAQRMEWVYVEIACNVIGPGFATIVALVTRSPSDKPVPVVPVVPAPASPASPTKPASE